MKLLIDTHVWLWTLESPARLNAKARRIIEDRMNAIYVSAASAWEIAIKVGLKKLELPLPPSEYVPSRMSELAMLPLPIEPAHVLHVAELPPHHRDPFDRLLVAQSQLENLPILTADPVLRAYDVRVIWAS
jgi:PIN domain nuclease of toxin-antitoxin system